MSFFSTKKISWLSPGEFNSAGGYKELWRIAYPLVIMCASHTVMQFVDRMFLAWNSGEDVAAALPAGILYFTLFCFFSVTLGFTSAVVAQLFGAKENRGCVEAAITGFFIAIALALFVGLVNPLIGTFLMSSGTQANADILNRQLAYFEGLRWSGAFVCMSTPLFAFFSGRGNTKPAALINTFGCVLNIFLDYVFIFGKCGFPAWGICGAGIATTICTAVTFLIILIVYLSVDQKLFPTRSLFLPKWRYVSKLFKFGAPAGMQVFCDTGAFAVVVLLTGLLPTEAQSATTIALSINNFAFVPMLGMADATAIVVGQYIGAKRKNVANRVAYRSWRMATLYMGCCALVYVTMPETLTRLFAPAEEGGAIDFSIVIENCRIILICAACFSVFDATKFVFLSALRGAGDTRFVFMISSGAAWLILVPGVTILIVWLKVSVLGVWIFLTVYTCLDACFMLWRFRTGKWRSITLVQSEQLVTETPVGESAVTGQV